MSSYQICQRCVMDTTDPLIEFNSDGSCIHCRGAEAMIQELLSTMPQRKIIWEQTVEKLKREGKGKDYDCVVGVSGGVDSSFVALLAKESGLRPVAIHMDNGWNSELAVANIKNLCETLKIDLITEVLDWDEFRDLQVAFLKASTPDSEAPTDHALIATLYHHARRMGIKYSLVGSNPYSESIGTTAWSDGQGDWRYINGLYKLHTGRNLKKMIHLTGLQMVKYAAGIGFKNVKPLFLLPFDKEQARRRLETEFGWRNYGGKHYESIYTKFFQGYILPTKFGYDKRKWHYSSYIAAGQMTRDEALEKLKEPPIPPDELRQDYKFVCKKLGITEAEMEAILAAPKKRYKDYPNSEWLVKLPSRLGKTRLRNVWTKLMGVPRSK